jgi:hypothetical protein
MYPNCNPNVLQSGVTYPNVMIILFTQIGASWVCPSMGPRPNRNLRHVTYDIQIASSFTSYHIEILLITHCQLERLNFVNLLSYVI